MDIVTFSQLGIGLATLFILWLVVKYFIDALTKKDEYIKEVVKDFNITINNHMAHETEAFNRIVNAIEKLTTGLDKNTKSMSVNTEEIRNGK